MMFLSGGRVLELTSTQHIPQLIEAAKYPIHRNTAHVIVVSPRDWPSVKTPFERLPQSGLITKQFHIFISYRVAANKDQAAKIWELLQNRTVRVEHKFEKSPTVSQIECVCSFAFF